jgi:catechol 2,3-dioxygenase-like lactoylglutathione lyase family enzyme
MNPDQTDKVSQDYVRLKNPPVVGPTDSIRTTGILHFTIGVRDHIAAAKFYADVLGLKLLRTNNHFSFMECHGGYFVLALMPKHVNPNAPGETDHHHAFLVDADEFDRAMEVLRVRDIPLVAYSDRGHKSFPGRHAYFHDSDGNAIEICTLYENGVEPPAPE